jgi:hypothetical protein
MNFLKKTKNKVSVNKDKIIALSGRSVKVDWLIMLTILIILLVVVIGWSISQYFKLSTLSVESSTQTIPARELIKMDQLNDVVQKYTTKTLQFEALVPGFQFYSVPSSVQIGDSFQQDVQKVEGIDLVESSATTSNATSSSSNSESQNIESEQNEVETEAQIGASASSSTTTLDVVTN